MYRKYGFYTVIAACLMALGGALGFWFKSHDDREHHVTAHHARAGTDHQHDVVNMPGLRGVDTTEQEVNDLRTIFRAHQDINRTVISLPDGIRTITESNNLELREAIITHVSLMVTRLQEGRNPEVTIQSPTLDKLFEVYDKIETEIELTQSGIAVLQTSTYPEVVQLLQTHADEVSDMSERGMMAVHERMRAAGQKQH